SYVVDLSKTRENITRQQILQTSTKYKKRHRSTKARPQTKKKCCKMRSLFLGKNFGEILEKGKN
ncbi:hypothetical protein ACP0FZ_30870, partial [Escherichia coli]|uniref:hypothetical protein n=1 Tax=Escherichia coli TaxID=562 RepID=UPI003CF31663